MQPSLRHASIASAMTLTLASMTTQAGPRNLNAGDLDEVTAGTQSPTTSNAANGSSIIVTDHSSIELRAERRVELHDQVQQRATALNAVNAANADVANAINISTVMGAHVLGRQLNQILQSERSYGRVEQLTLAGPRLNRSYSTNRSYGSITQSTSMQAAQLRSRSSSSVVDTYAASVPAYFPLQNMTLTIGTPDMPSVTVPQFGFDLTTTDDVGGTYGIRGSLGAFTFDPPQIVLGTVSFQGDDLVVAGGYVDLPSLDLGSASVTACFVECGSVDVDLPTIDGPRIDLPGEWRLEGANPFKDVRITAGNGIAAAGSGHINIDAAHVTLAAELSLDLPDLTTEFSFDVLGHEVSTGEFGVAIPAISASITLVDADVGPSYSANFDGALCVAVQTSDCGTLQHSRSSGSTLVDIRQTTATSSTSSYDESTSAGAEYLTAGATLSGADAELIAMSEGRADIAEASVIELGSQAQRSLQALNAINAAGAIVGNAMNVGTQRAGAGAAGLTQTNVFSQFKTRPREP